MESRDRLHVTAVRKPNGACASAVPVVSTVSEGDDQEESTLLDHVVCIKRRRAGYAGPDGHGVGEPDANEVDRCGRGTPPRSATADDATIQPSMIA